MKKATSILFMLVFMLLASSIVVAQQPAVKGSKKATTNKVTIDTRVDNMGYWGEMARLGVVPVAPDVQVEKATFTGMGIKAKTVFRDVSPDVPLTTVNSTQSECSVFADPSDKNHALNSNNSTQNPVGQLYGANDFYTFDGGTVWGGEVQGAGGSNSGDPTTAIGNGGRMYVNYIHNNYGQGISYSDNDGQSWTTKQVAPNPGSMCDKNHMWIDNSVSSPYEGNLYVAWTNFGGSNDTEIGIARSTNDGVTWSSPMSISNAINAGSHNQGVNVHTGPNGEVYALWAVYDSWPSDETALGFAKSTDGGATFAPATRIITNIRGIRTSGTSKNQRVNSFPSMAVDISNSAHRGTIYAVWANIGIPGVNTGTGCDVYMIKSTDMGATWTTPMRINTDPFGNNKQHYFPWICCDPANGTLSCIWYDDRNTTATKCEAWAANSRDGGATWEDFKISDVSFTPTPIPGLAGQYMGDYLGITSQNRKVYPVWCDNRTGTVMAYTSPFETGPPPNQPWVAFQSVVVNNASGRLATGETAGLNVTMENIGDQPTDNVTVTISSTSPYVNIIDNSEFFGHFDVAALVTITNAFTIQATNNVPNGTDIAFDVVATNGDSTWLSNFTVKAYAPVLTVGGMSINDASGNGNGGLDPGETADIVISTTNNGGFDANNTIATLACSNPLITINSATFNMGNLVIGQTGFATFNVTVSPAAPMDTLIHFNYTATSGGYAAQKTFDAVVGLIFDGFESGNFNVFSYVQGGSAPWTITNVDPIEGIYCAKSGTIGPNGSSLLSLTYNVARNDSISFFRKVSSQPTYDFLGFYIDNVQKGQWSGEKAWTRVSFPVPAGVHTFKWAYYKNANTTTGSDCGWIDYIIFPPSVSTAHAISGKVTYPNASNSPLSNVLLSLKNNSGSVVATTTTNATGDYAFENLPDGVYTIESATSRPWSDVTAADALLFKKHIASITPLTGIYLASGDVNASGSLTAADVLLIKKRIAAIISSFPVGDWLFNATPITLVGGNVVKDYYGIIYGDANASYNPSSSKSSVVPQPSDAVFTIGSTTTIDNDVVVPVYVSGVQNLGSFQFTLQYDPKKLAYSDVTDWSADMNSVVVGSTRPGQLTFVWTAENSGIDITEGTMMNIHFKSRKSDVSEISWTSDPTPVEFGDFNGNLFTPALKSGTVNTYGAVGSVETQDIAISPNPGKGIFTVTCNSSIQGSYLIQVVNSVGKIVYDETRTISGKFTIDLNSLSDGAYYLKVENNSGSFLKKLVIQK